MKHKSNSAFTGTTLVLFLFFFVYRKKKSDIENE